MRVPREAPQENPRRTAAVPPGAPEVDARLRDLSRLAGTWEGTARIATQNGTLEVIHHEQVQVLLGGHLVTMHGRSQQPDAQRSAPPAFEAFALITCDPDGGPLFVAHRGRSRLVTPVDLGPGRYTWTAPGPSGPIRYEASYDDETWQEVGVLAQSGSEVFSMRLARLTA